MPTKTAVGTTTTNYLLGFWCRELQRPKDQGVLNEDKESEMQSIGKFTEENSLQFHQQKTASILVMEFVSRSAYNS